MDIMYTQQIHLPHITQQIHLPHLPHITQKIHLPHLPHITQQIHLPHITQQIHLTLVVSTSDLIPTPTPFKFIQYDVYSLHIE